MKKFIFTFSVLSLLPSFAFAEVIKSQTSPINTTYSYNTNNSYARPMPNEYGAVSNDFKATQNTKTATPENIKKSFQEDDGYFLEGFQFGVGLGALGGANAQIGYRIPQRSYNFWKNRFGFRLDYNSWEPLQGYIEDYLEDNPIEVDNNNFYGKIEGTNYGALIDFYPFGNTWALGNFRLSAGYYSGDFSVGGTLHTKASETFEMENSTYKITGDADLTAMLEADVKGPYAGVGFDFALLWGLKMYFDAGLVFTDKPTISTALDATGKISVNGGPEQDIDSGAAQDIINELLEETKREYEKELEDITKEYFPMIKIGFMYRF